MSEDLRHPELTALETALAGLKPAAPGLDRDRLMYQAGRASARGGRWLWPGTTAALAAAVVVLGGLLAARPALREVVYLEMQRPEASVDVAKQELSAPASRPGFPPGPREPFVRGDYWRLRDEMLAGRVSPPAAPTYSAPEDLSLDHLLGLPPDSLDRVSRSRLQRALLRSGESL